jgi:hypothetical protein
MGNVQESYPAQTTGLGVAAKISVVGNLAGGSSVPGYNNVVLSKTGATYAGVTYPETFQLSPNIEDAGGNELTPGTAYALTSVASSSGSTAVYTGTIVAGANALVGKTFVVAGYVAAANNGTFICTANNGSTTITLENASATSATAQTATATSQEVIAGNVYALTSAANAVGANTVYTGTVVAAAHSLIGETFVVASFGTAADNGTFVCVDNNGTTTLTLANANGAAESAQTATATQQVAVGEYSLTYVVYDFKTTSTGTDSPSSTPEAIVSVSANGLLTALYPGGSVVEVSYPTFDNESGVTGAASGNPIYNLPKDKIYAEVSVTVLP